MSSPSVSVVVVSRGRPELLLRCLTGCRQLYYPKFEIVVVADPAGIAAVEAMGLAGRIKAVPFDEANISAARNAGIKAAAGEIIAFIDDDAVPEPTWLDYLTAPFDEPSVAAAGGFVRGRNGISFQFTAALISPVGEDVPINVPGTAPFVPETPAGHAVKTMGTNCAFRRKNVALIGGLDPVFRFFHDETDLNMRLAKTGVRSAIVPLAQVHHGTAASGSRAADRAPVSLYEVGASTAVFLRKYAPGAQAGAAWERLVHQQRARLIRHMVGGGLEPRDVDRRMQGLLDGYKAGLAREIRPLEPLPDPVAGFLPLRQRPAGRAVFLAGRSWNYRRLHRAAIAQVAAGNVATVLRLSPTALFHRVVFSQHGYWRQTGGLFGRAERSEPAFRMVSFRRRQAEEQRRVAGLRQTP